MRVTVGESEPTFEELPYEFVLANDYYTDNGELIAAAAQLGYLKRHWRICDPTYGRGTFWSRWRPNELVASDLDPRLSPCGESLDATDLPYDPESFDAVVIDGPYKLNGTPDPIVDSRYGTQIPTRWQERLSLLDRMLIEGFRIVKGLRAGKDNGYVLFKCQDQVCSGKMRWQTYRAFDVADRYGFGMVDRLNYLGGRMQPEGRRQLHARQNASSLLVFKYGW